jgi:cyclophilin family peptidyl-prolyl cis-trans isomerase
MTLWGTMLSALAVALVAPGAASATTCTPNPTSPIVRFSTSVGNIDVQLNGTDAPCTVQNFETYMNGGKYSGSFFHRSVTSPDVIQGGGFTFSNGKPVAIPTASPIQNEYKDPNIADSIAMALSGTQSTTCELDASATDEWFFNVADNSEALDEQCFTVFGQALDPASIAVINKIAGEPVCDVDTAFGGTVGGTYANVPLLDYNTNTECTGTPAGSGDGPELNAGAPAITSSNLVFVNSITILNDTSPPAITVSAPVQHQTLNLGQKITPAYSCNDGTGVGVDTCTGPATVNTNLYGTLQYTVTATDYAGNSDTKTITYLVELPPTLASLGTVSSKGVLSLKIHCPASVACVGTADLIAGKLTLIGGTRFNIRAGATGSVRLPLTAAGWRSFRAAKWRLKAALAITPTGVGSKSSTDKITLTRAKAKPKPKPKPKHKKH